MKGLHFWAGRKYIQKTWFPFVQSETINLDSYLKGLYLSTGSEKGPRRWKYIQKAWFPFVQSETVLTLIRTWKGYSSQPDL